MANSIVANSDLRDGDCIEVDGLPCLVLDCTGVQVYRKGIVHKMKLMNIDTGEVFHKTDEGMNIYKRLPAENAKCHYAYYCDGVYNFMNIDTYDMYEASEDIIGDKKYYLTDGETYTLVVYEGRVLMLYLPVSVTLTVEKTSGGGFFSSKDKMYDAILDTGLKIQVPGNIRKGDKVVVTFDGRFLKKVD